MTPELIIGGANLLALMGYALRMESRMTRLEAQMEAVMRKVYS